MFAAQTSVVWALWVPSRHSLNNILFPSSLQKLGRIGCNHSLHESTLRSSKRSLMAEYLLELKMYGRILSWKKERFHNKNSDAVHKCVCVAPHCGFLLFFSLLLNAELYLRDLNGGHYTLYKPGRITEKSLGDPSEKGRVEHEYQWIPLTSGYQSLGCNLPL